jgi:hypothetical protein
MAIKDFSDTTGAEEEVVYIVPTSDKNLVVIINHAPKSLVLYIG